MTPPPKRNTSSIETVSMIDYFLRIKYSETQIYSRLKVNIMNFRNSQFEEVLEFDEMNQHPEPKFGKLRVSAVLSLLLQCQNRIAKFAINTAAKKESVW